jgi:hypothetical protein
MLRTARRRGAGRHKGPMSARDGSEQLVSDHGDARGLSEPFDNQAHGGLRVDEPRFPQEAVRLI